MPTTSASTTEMKIWQVYLWCMLVGHCTSAHNKWTPISVDRSLSVARGGQVDLRAAITYHRDAVTTDCSVQFLPAGSCGQVRPSRFSCSNYFGAILYQHIGCPTEVELATFLASSPTDTSANVSIFSVEIMIGPPHSLTTEITLELLEGHDLDTPLEDHNYRIVFPAELIGKCHYEVVTDWQRMPLPSSGVVMGASNQLLPCGFTDSSGLIYIPSNSSSPPKDDHLLVKLHSYDHRMQDCFVFLPMNLGTEDDNSTSSGIQELPTQFLVVHQGANTPIPPSLLTFQNSLHSFQLNDSQPLYLYTFPVLEAGTFRSSLSSSVNVTRTVFTSRELLNGNIAFYPNFSAAEQAVFHYSISNVAGVVVAIGDVNVTVQRHKWEWPVQRTNAPLQVMEGGSSIFDQRTLDFYLQTDLCTQHAAMSLLVSPVHGHLTFLNGSDVSSTSLLISAMRNGTVMVYTHSSGSKELTDSIVWKVSCPGVPDLQVFTSILIAPSGDSPTVLLRGWDIKIHRGWATPLSPSIIDIYDRDAPHDEISVTADKLSGGLFKVDWMKLNGDHFHCFLPFVEAETLLSQDIAQDVSNISISDLESYKIWYVPPANSSTDQLLKFSVGDSTASVGVHIIDYDLNQTLYLTTQDEYPSIARNLPLPLHTLTGTCITSSYLYSQALPHPPDKVVYVVHSPPSKGLLCLLSGENCQTSTNRFTQRDINSQHVFYKPGGTGSVEEDYFLFELTLDGIHQHTEILHQFHFKPVPTVVEVSLDRTFFVNAGDSKAIALRHFRPFSQFLNSRDIVFQVTHHPHYGRLELQGEPNPSNFSFDDLKRRDLVYWHHLSAMNSCSDQFSFSVGNATHSLDGTMKIAIKRGREGIQVQVNVGHHTLYSSQRKFVFGSDDITVSSSFCLDFVTFTLHSLPSLGVLSLVDNKHNTVVQLEQNSTFSANDVYSGFVHYTFTNKEPMRSQISDMFILSADDPTSTWPSPNTNRQNTDETDGHFIVTIIPSQGIEHKLAVNITSPGFLTWLPDYKQYGYIFSENDILIYNSTIEPHQVVIQLDREPEFGSIWKQNSMENIFSVEDINNGLVWYRSDVRLNGLSRDSFLMSFIVTLMDFSMFVDRKEFVINWATVQLQNSSLFVRESDGQVEVVVRRTGSLWSESQALVTTVAESAITNTGCRSPADFCNMSQVVVFPINVTEKSIIIEIDDDDIAEDTETFSVVLGDPSNVVIDESRNHTKIWISDTEDYSVITMMGSFSANPECSYVTRVEEGDGKARIKLQRTRNLQQRVGVVCYTGAQSNFARANESVDYVPRHRNQLSSIVWFEANQEFAYCDIDIIDDDKAEFIERFFVKLNEETRGRAVLSDPNDVHCVEISNDRNDLPRINFTTPELIVRESNTTDILVPITLLRTGPDLSQETEVKCQQWLLQGKDHATPGLDFSLPQNESCLDDNTSSCVTFRPGERRAVLHVIIKHDNILEANESFHLILETAYKVYPNVMNVVILEGFSPAVIGFAEPVYVVEETSGLTSNTISIVRTGYPNSSVDVFCRLKGVPNFGNATASDRPGEGSDFITPPKPSKVTLEPGDTTNKACSLYVADDSVWEGPESLTVELELSRESLGAELLEEMSRAQVIIDDSEDIPTMQFHEDSSLVSVMEPLSNFDIDKTTVNLTLVRTGDQSYTTSVVYKVYENHSRAALSEGEVVFNRNANEKQIEIVLRANHERNEELLLNVELFKSKIFGDVDVPVEIGARYRADIVIQNTEYVGPFFPDLPIVANEGVAITANTNTLYYDHPLLCITPCSGQYIGNSEKLSCFRQACASENISQNDTIYSWEISQDGVNFTTLVHTTSFTNTHSERLDSFYLMPNLHVRCKAQAISPSGLKGHARTSRSVTLSGKKYSCNGREKAEVELTSYSSFSGHNKDLLRLSVRVPHRTNTIPVLSSRPVQNVSNVDAHGCSTLTPGKRFSWLDKEPLYSHLDRERCTWEFSRWLPVDDWLQQCGGWRGYSSDTDFINISVYSAYHEYWLSATVEQEPITGQINYSTAGSTPFLPPPLHMLSSTGNSDAYIYPIAMQEMENPAGFQVYFYSVLPLGFRQTYAPSYSSSAVLLHMDTTTNTSKQAWRLELGRTLPKAIPLEFQLPCGAECITANGTLTFSLAMTRDREEYTPALRTTVTLQHNPEAANNHTQQFTLGDQVYIVFDLDPAVELQDGFVFNVSEVNLCRRTEMGNSTNQQIIMTGVAPDTSAFDVDQEHTAVLHFSTSSIKVEQSPSLWCLDITYGISKDHNMVLKENTIINITFVDPARHTTYSAQTAQQETTPSSQSFLYAAVVVLVMALLILGVSCTVIGISVWTSRMKAKIKQKVQSQLEAQRQSGSRKNSVALNNRKRESVPSESEQILQRSQSTTGFPTREKLKRVRTKRSTSTMSRVDTNSNQRTCLTEAGASARQVTTDEGASVQPFLPISHCTVKRAQSLPNLTILETRMSEGFFMGEPQPRKLHFQTTVSKVNTERWHLNKWAQHHIKANKQLETARTIHDLATRRRNYGANESKQNVSLNKESHNELARYAVRSLAASAKTPEPEKGPRTKL